MAKQIDTQRIADGNQSISTIQHSDGSTTRLKGPAWEGEYAAKTSNVPTNLCPAADYNPRGGLYSWQNSPWD